MIEAASGTAVDRSHDRSHDRACRPGAAARLRAIACQRLEAARDLRALAPNGVQALKTLEAQEGADGPESEQDVEGLLATFLDARERCMARLVADDVEWRALAASVAAAPDPSDEALLAEVREIGRETGALLEAIAAEDADLLSALAARRERVAASLGLARDGRALHRAYAPPAAGCGADAPRFMDRRC